MVSITVVTGAMSLTALARLISLSVLATKIKHAKAILDASTNTINAIGGIIVETGVTKLIALALVIILNARVTQPETAHTILQAAFPILVYATDTTNAEIGATKPIVIALRVILNASVIKRKTVAAP